MDEDLGTTSRRMVLGGALAVGAVAGLGAQRAQAAPVERRRPRRKGQKSMIGVPYAQRDTVRVGVIGLGNRGSGMALGWASIPGGEVTAVCDIRADRANRVADRLQAAGHDRPATIGGSESSYLELLRRDDVDYVYIATPWEFHFSQGRDALRHDKDAAVELPIAMELDELWELVDASEQSRRHLMLAENCNYGRNELAMLKMARAGLFGEITDAHGGYLHDLRELLFSDTYYTDAWRRKWHTRSRAAFYTMHGLGPMSACLDINRGERYVSLVAIDTPAEGLADYRERFVPRDHPSWQEEYVHGDVQTVLLTTNSGKMCRAVHSVSSPRPYSRINSLQGSRGIVEDYPERIYVEPDHKGHAWADFGPYRDKHEHWLWRKLREDAEGGGHGGMDWIMQWRIVQQIRTGQVPDIDVYDSAVWCSSVPLSAESLKKERAVAVPDFTRGDWDDSSRGGLDSAESDMPG
ncbi:putative dehydrogenase [Naumannella cuiyingiana]|uniref:Glycosyl hydrolase family 109 protein n=1 Tax=Naumannella cuiyingiana TaxID=1347891 RepID=A0A7Z0IK88_9ACTN|nr:Gfo/Idh/MocA family oxidoreductase [Naumannella cuiyingiana]NYI70263.1 putative dehydrogenase [Naumannella cuiyingiana]